MPRSWRYATDELDDDRPSKKWRWVKMLIFWGMHCYVGYSDEDGGYLGEIYTDEGVYADSIPVCKSRAEAIAISKNYAKELATLWR